MAKEAAAWAHAKYVRDAAERAVAGIEVKIEKLTERLTSVKLDLTDAKAELIAAEAAVDEAYAAAAAVGGDIAVMAESADGRGGD